MAYRANPFLERMSERTTSDQEFVRLFSPKILERLPDEAFVRGVHIFRSPPGGGKTTLLRAFTPSALRAFWHSQHVQEISETFRGLVQREILDETKGPLVLGVYLSCASGYSDLPPGATLAREGLLRALLDCRVVLRALRSIVSLIGNGSSEGSARIQLMYDGNSQDLKSIPRTTSFLELVDWAESRERSVYAQLDSMTSNGGSEMPTDLRLESVLWLQSVRFTYEGNEIANKRILMLDDLHKLRRKQRALLIQELLELRPSIPVWMAERSIALGDELLSQGVREGRELTEYPLEDIWAGGYHQFAYFAQNVLDRRLDVQSRIPTGPFAQYLGDELRTAEVKSQVAHGIETVKSETETHANKPRYVEWLKHAERLTAEETVESLRNLIVTRTLLARDESKRQLSLSLGPLPTAELEQRDSSQVQSAAEIFMNQEFGIPYYFGIDRICILANNNVEELLALAAALYEAILAKQVLRKRELILSAGEQERLVKEVAKRKRQFIPKNHTEGGRAQLLLDSIGSYCFSRTFLRNAPYAPGVTGVRLSRTELLNLRSDELPLREYRAILKRVLSECVAENLLIKRLSAESTSRESGTIFYLNRTLCVYYGLPLQMGGWQDVTIEQLISWMERGRTRSDQRSLGIK